jgi:hypothetical protein
MEGHYVCERCGERTTDPVTLACCICDVEAERDRYREALELIAEETGTPYATIAERALRRMEASS